eukprot:7832382-Pyramimonas_sp.AAC.2
MTDQSDTGNPALQGEQPVEQRNSGRERDRCVTRSLLHVSFLRRRNLFARTRIACAVSAWRGSYAMLHHSTKPCNKGYMVDGKGYSVDAKGYSVDAKGWMPLASGGVDAGGAGGGGPARVQLA